MKNFVLLIAFISMAASSTDAFSFETKTKDCMKTFETNLRSNKTIKSKKAVKKKKVKGKSE